MRYLQICSKAHKIRRKAFYLEGMVTPLPAVPIDLGQFQLYVSSSNCSLVAYLVPENKTRRDPALLLGGTKKLNWCLLKSIIS